MRINPSILSADFANMETSLAAIADADMVHVDVMDSHFVPNLTFGLPVAKRYREVSPIPFDAHLMISDPMTWAPEYAEFSEMVTFHVEPVSDVAAVIEAIVAKGAKAGIAVKPDTDVAPFLKFIPDISQFLVMTVEPGFGGQELIPHCLEKVALVREFIDQGGHECFLQVDGGINEKTIAKAAAHGADTFVAGSAVFGLLPPGVAIENLRVLAKR